MSRIPLEDIEQYEDESTIEKFKKKKPSNPNKKHDKKGKKHYQEKDLDWNENYR